MLLVVPEVEKVLAKGTSKGAIAPQLPGILQRCKRALVQSCIEIVLSIDMLLFYI